MSITSLLFFLLFFASIVVYYLIPPKNQWYVLLGCSIGFFLVSSVWYTALYLLVSIIVTVICTKMMEKEKAKDKDDRSKYYLMLGLIINIGLLAILKYGDFLLRNLVYIERTINSIPGVNLHYLEGAKWKPASPIGISFYTLQIIGYLLDVYWGIVEPQKNPFKTALFIGYYPQLISGPIARYSQMKEQLFSGTSFSYQMVSFGAQRILWGCFKKLVISSRIKVFVDAVYLDPVTYHGIYVWLAAFAFMLQLYTDFSGCMDIVLGASECYGIELPENFRTPFFSRSVQEYWQRWHITLGSWLKDYVLYPILRSSAWRKMTKNIKKRIGKKASKQIPSYLGMLCVWLLIGLWHGGGWNYIIGMGLWFWTCITLAQVFNDTFIFIRKKLNINEYAFLWKVFQATGVFVLVSIGNVFFRAESLSLAVNQIKMGLTEFNPWILFDGSIINTGISYSDLNIICFSVILMLVCAIVQEKKGSIRVWLSSQFFVFRWMLWISLFFFVVIYGVYGPGYNASEFIYGGF